MLTWITHFIFSWIKRIILRQRGVLKLSIILPLMLIFMVSNFAIWKFEKSNWSSVCGNETKFVHSSPHFNWLCASTVSLIRSVYYIVDIMGWPIFIQCALICMYSSIWNYHWLCCGCLNNGKHIWSCSNNWPLLQNQLMKMFFMGRKVPSEVI